MNVLSIVIYGWKNDAQVNADAKTQQASINQPDFIRSLHSLDPGGGGGYSYIILYGDEPLNIVSGFQLRDRVSFLKIGPMTGGPYLSFLTPKRCFRPFARLGCDLNRPDGNISEYFQINGRFLLNFQGRTQFCL